MARSLGREGRIAWMLRYLAAPGGPQRPSPGPRLERWASEQWTCGDRHARFATRRFTAAFQKHRRARLHDLKAAYRAGALPLLVDTRAQADVDGAVHDDLPRKGRLPGAILAAYAGLFDDAGGYVACERYSARMPDDMRAARALRA